MQHNTDRADVSSAIAFLTKRLAAVSSLVGEPSPSVNMLQPANPGERRRGPTKSVLLDVAKGLA